MTIKEIFHTEHISVRSFNVCNYNGLKDLSAILKYYREKRTFINLRNCGRNSNEELITLCLKYMDYENNHFPEPLKPEEQLIAITTNFTRTQREIVNSFIEINANNLSNRSKNAIFSFLNGNLKIRNVIDSILSNDKFNFKNIKNVGIKTVTELESFIESIKEFIEKVSEIDNESGLVALRNRFFIEKTFSINSIPIEILESQSIFRLVNFLINKNAIFEKNDNIIFLKAFKIFDNQPELTLEEIAEEVSISKERVRQTRKGVVENLYIRLQFIRNIEDDLYQKYDIDLNQHLINIDSDLNCLINQANGTNFSREFNSFIIYTYISDRYYLVGKIEDVLQPKKFNSRDRHNWENFYLVRKHLINQFDFNKLVDDIEKRINDRIDETYNFNFKSYLYNFVLTEDSSLIKDVFPVAERIINQEFDLLIDLYDNIVFRRNTVKQVSEYAIEALEKLGVPSKIDKIFELIEKEYPEITKSQEALRGSLLRTSEIISFGRCSTYGLKIWETEKEGIKGGTIRSIVLEYLESHLEPQHISTITSYVLQFRPKTDEYSILQNLKLDETGNFLFFKNSYVGLSSMNYNKSYILVSDENTIEIKTWEERYSDLLIFLNQNDRLPFSSGCPENEIKLYRWYKIQLGNYRRGNLDSDRSTLLKDIFNKFEQNSTRKRRTNVTNKYNELITFVMERKRLPSANNEGEENLYQFFYKQRKFYDKGELRPDEEQNFIKVAKIIQTHKYEN